MYVKPSKSDYKKLVDSKSISAYISNLLVNLTYTDNDFPKKRKINRYINKRQNFKKSKIEYFNK